RPGTVVCPRTVARTAAQPARPAGHRTGDAPVAAEFVPVVALHRPAGEFRRHLWLAWRGGRRHALVLCLGLCRAAGGRTELATGNSRAREGIRRMIRPRAPVLSTILLLLCGVSASWSKPFIPAEIVLDGTARINVSIRPVRFHFLC